jgi:hypothetical protein
LLVCNGHHLAWLNFKSSINHIYIFTPSRIEPKDLKLSLLLQSNIVVFSFSPSYCKGASFFPYSGRKKLAAVGADEVLNVEVRVSVPNITTNVKCLFIMYT